MLSGLIPTLFGTVACGKSATKLDSFDEASMLQMPVVEKTLEVDQDASDCRCPGYFQEQCEAEAAQGCVWSAAGSSNGAWCQCLNPPAVALAVPFIVPTLPPQVDPLVTNQCASGNYQTFFDAIFSSLGTDCETYIELYAEGAQYYHQHDGHKSYAELQQNCENFGAYFPAGTSAFRQAGDALLGFHDGDDCHFLVPYLWSDVPATAGKPHTGWEYIIATQDSSSQFGYKMKHFAEIETTFTVPFNWHNPRDTPALFSDSTLAELHLTTSDTTDACDAPLANTLTDFLQQQEVRQQGDAVALAAGGLCQVAVPFASEAGGNLMGGYFVLRLEKTDDSYNIMDSTKFQSP